MNKNPNIAKMALTLPRMKFVGFLVSTKNIYRVINMWTSQLVFLPIVQIPDSLYFYDLTRLGPCQDRLINIIFYLLNTHTRWVVFVLF